MTAIRALDGLCIDSNHHQNYSIPTYLHGSFLVDDIKVDVYQIKKKKVKLNTIVILPTFSFFFSVPQNKVDWPDMYTLIDFPPVHMVYTLIKLAAILCVWLTIRHRLFMATTVCYNAVVIGKKLLAISSYNSRRHTHTHTIAPWLHFARWIAINGSAPLFPQSCNDSAPPTLKSFGENDTIPSFWKGLRISSQIMRRSPPSELDQWGAALDVKRSWMVFNFQSLMPFPDALYRWHTKKKKKKPFWSNEQLWVPINR